jgi:hypothetical protein
MRVAKKKFFTLEFVADFDRVALSAMTYEAKSEAMMSGASQVFISSGRLYDVKWELESCLTECVFRV